MLKLGIIRYGREEYIGVKWWKVCRKNKDIGKQEEGKADFLKRYKSR